MTRIQFVVDLVRQRGRASVDDILPDCPGMTRKQAAKALDNAVTRGYLCSLGMTLEDGQRLVRYVAKNKKPPTVAIPDMPPPRGLYWRIGKVSSVFAMAAGLGA